MQNAWDHGGSTGQGMCARVVAGSLWEGDMSSCECKSKASVETQIRWRCQCLQCLPKKTLAWGTDHMGCRQQEQGKGYLGPLGLTSHRYDPESYWIWSYRIQCFSCVVSVLLWSHSSLFSSPIPPLWNGIFILSNCTLEMYNFIFTFTVLHI